MAAMQAMATATSGSHWDGMNTGMETALPAIMAVQNHLARRGTMPASAQSRREGPKRG
jgi:hypothetical protein